MVRAKKPLPFVVKADSTTLRQTDPLADRLLALSTYHFDLWAEIEGQLQTLLAVQRGIRVLRDSASSSASVEQRRQTARSLAQHVQTLKGRTASLSSTISELERTVDALIALLDTPE